MNGKWTVLYYTHIHTLLCNRPEGLSCSPVSLLQRSHSTLTPLVTYMGKPFIIKSKQHLNLSLNLCVYEK